MTETKSIYSQLASIDVSGKTEKKGKFTYLSWTYAVDQLLQVYPEAKMEVSTNPDGLPFFSSGNGVFVHCKVTVDGVTREQWHPVMDFKNKSVASPDACQIHTSIQRCMTKAIAMHGLGLNIYAGEDLPLVEADEDPEDPPSTANGKSKSKPTTKKSSTDKKKVEAETKTNGSQGLTKDEILEALRGAVGKDVLDDKQAVFNVADKLFNEGKKGFNASKLTALPVDKLNLVLDEIKKQIEEINK